MDSTAITVAAARILRARGEVAPFAVSWSPPPSEASGGVPYELIDSICRQHGLPMSYCTTTPEVMAKVFDGDIVTKPFFDIVHENEAQQRMVAAGTRWVLSGWGGDDAASLPGVRVVIAHLQRGRWLRTIDLFDLRRHLLRPRAFYRAARNLWRKGLYTWLQIRFGRGRGRIHDRPVPLKSSFERQLAACRT